MTRDQVAKHLGFVGEDDTRLRSPERCSHEWIRLTIPQVFKKPCLPSRGHGPWGCKNCASYLTDGVRHPAVAEKI